MNYAHCLNNCYSITIATFIIFIQLFCFVIDYFHFYCRKLGKEGLQKLNQMHKLGDFNGGTVFEVTSSRPINTSNGECLLVDFSTESDEGTVTGKLIIPDRIRKEIEGKTPLILYYDGKKMGKKNQQFHDLTVINLDCDRVVKTPVKSKTLGKELVSSILSSNDNARATFSDNEDNDYEDDDAAWKPPICSKNAPCKQNNNTCYGWCNLCRSHQPFDGSQCVCH